MGGDRETSVDNPIPAGHSVNMTKRPSVRDRIRKRLPFDANALLVPQLRRFFVATLFGCFGMGVVFVFFVLYCVHIRHLPVLAATSLLAWESVLGVALAPLYGTVIDRYGPSIVLAIVMPIEAIGLISIGFASTVPTMLVACTLFSAGGAGLWSAINVMIARLVDEEHRQDAFGLNFMLVNVGIGVGSLVGSSVADLHSLRSFQVLYALSGVLTFIAAAILLSLRRYGGKPEAPAGLDAASQGWRAVLADRRMVRFVIASLIMVVCGYGSFEAGIPLFVTSVDHLSVHVIGLLVASNTMTIVVAQLFVLTGIKGRSRSLLLGAVGLLWGISWILATSSLVLGAVGAVIALCLGQVVFAIGETIWQPVSPALVNELAPEHLRGRYNAAIGIIWAVSSAIGQSIAGAFFYFRAGTAWTIVLAVGALVGGIGLTTMRRVLTPEEDGRVKEHVA